MLVEYDKVLPSDLILFYRYGKWVRKLNMKVPIVCNAFGQEGHKCTTCNTDKNTQFT